MHNSIKFSLFVYVLLLFSSECFALEGTYIEKVLKRYGELKSYCDSGKLIMRGLPAKFERCFNSNGAYKQAVYTENYWKNRNIEWSDGKIWNGITGYIKNGILKTNSHVERPVTKKQRNVEYIVPDLILKFFQVKVLSDLQSYLNSNLDEYVMNKELSNSDFTVLDLNIVNKRTKKNASTHRLWVSNSDLIVIKSIIYWNSKIIDSYEVTAYRINDKLTKEDLSYAPPENSYTAPKRSYVQSEKSYTRPQKSVQAELSGTGCLAKNNLSTIRSLHMGYKKRFDCIRVKTAAECVAKYGKADKIITRSDGSEVYLYYGKKSLSFGTGLDNKTIGKEWKELVIRDGKLVNERETRQMVESGYSWMKPRTDKVDSYRCQAYGSCKKEFCSPETVIPIHPLPRLTTLSKSKKTYSNKELSAQYTYLVILSSCSDVHPNSKSLVDRALNNLFSDDVVLHGMLKKTPTFEYDKNILKTKAKVKISTQANNIINQLQSEEMCRKAANNIIAHFKPVDKNRSSPDRVWRLFILSLKNGNSKKAVSYLTGRANQTLKPVLLNM